MSTRTVQTPGFLVKLVFHAICNMEDENTESGTSLFARQSDQPEHTGSAKTGYIQAKLDAAALLNIAK